MVASKPVATDTATRDGKNADDKMRRIAHESQLKRSMTDLWQPLDWGIDQRKHEMYNKNYRNAKRGIFPIF